MEADYIKKSREYIQEGKIEKAQIILRRILSENPNQPEAMELSGDIAHRLGQTAEAIQRYDNASNKYVNNNMYAEAIICLEKIIRLDTANEEVFSRLADLYRFYGLPNRAVRTILQLSSWALHNKQDAIFLSGLRKIVEVQPKNLPLRLAFSKVLFSVGRKQDAQDELKKLKSLAEDAGNEEVLEQVNKILPQPDGGEELDPKSRIELGNLLYEIGSKDEAIIEFEKAVSDLIETGETEDALNVLNRIVEIDPNNDKAFNKIKELKGEAVVASKEEAPKAPPEEEIEQAEVVEEAPEEAPSEVPEEEVVAAPEEQVSEEALDSAPEEKTLQTPADDTGMEMFQDLGQDIEGYVPAGEDETTTSEVTTEAATSEETLSPDDVAQLEGQIADIEFLLKETETATSPSFEIAKEFDGFRSSIKWQDEDSQKLLTLSKRAFENALFETSLRFIEDVRFNKETWPLSLEIYGGTLIKLGRYNDAKKNMAAALLYEEIPEAKKLEMRYLLASAYEGLGDFDNAMREIERIMSIDHNYKDVRELYALLGGKEIVEEPAPQVVTPEPVTEKMPQSPQPVPPVSSIPEMPSESTPPSEPVEKTPVSEPPLSEQMYPTIVDEMPRDSVTEKPVPQQPKKPPIEDITEGEEPKGENIAFL